MPTALHPVEPAIRGDLRRLGRPVPARRAPGRHAADRRRARRLSRSRRPRGRVARRAARAARQPRRPPRAVPGRLAACIMIEERKTRGGGTIGLRVDITEMKQREEWLPPAVREQSGAAAGLRRCGRDASARPTRPPAPTSVFAKGEHRRPARPQPLFEADEWHEAAPLLRQRLLRQGSLLAAVDPRRPRLESVLFTRRIDDRRRSRRRSSRSSTSPSGAAPKRAWRIWPGTTS